VDLCEKKTTTAFFDGDRGGELILRELLQVADIDYVAFSPRGKSVEDMTRKEVIKTLRNKVPVEYVRDQYFEDAAELPELSVQKGGSDSDDGHERRARHSASGKRREPGSAPQNLRDHFDDVRGNNLARFLSDDLAVVRELPTDEVEKAIETIDSAATGLVLDRPVDQKLLDRMVQRGLSYVAAKDFRGIVKRPLSIRLLKMGT